MRIPGAALQKAWTARGRNEDTPPIKLRSVGGPSELYALRKDGARAAPICQNQREPPQRGLDRSVVNEMLGAACEYGPGEEGA